MPDSYETLELFPDLIVGGFPCQDLSTAGAGAGLAGARSGLFWEIIRIARECETEWLFLENVPGLLSKRHVRDMGTVVGALGECGYGWAYRCVDAQYFGVPQRRRRVFFVGRLGDDGRASSEVLALAEGRSGDPAPSWSTRQEPSGDVAERTGATRGVASALTSSIRFGVDDNQAQAGHLIIAPPLADTLTAGSHSPNVSPPGRRQEDDTNLVVSVMGQISHTLTAEGADASEDGTGRGTPIVTYRKSKRAQSDQDDETWVEDDKANTLNLFDIGDVRATELIVEEPMAFMWQAGGNNSAASATSVGRTPTLPAKQTIAVHTGTVVRRLTPTECERLQGFPDGHTTSALDEKTNAVKSQADSHRYKQMGNAVAVPCVAWILQRLVGVAGVRLPRHDAVIDELREGVADVRAEVAVALAARDLPGSAPEIIGDADVA